MQKKQKDFGTKYENGKIIIKKAEWINNMETELRMLEEGSQGNIHLDTLKATLKKYQTLIAYTDFGLKIHLNPQQTCYQNE